MVACKEVQQNTSLHSVYNLHSIKALKDPDALLQLGASALSATEDGHMDTLKSSQTNLFVLSQISVGLVLPQCIISP